MCGEKLSTWRRCPSAERTLARTRHARDYDEAIERDREGEVLEAMLD